MTDDVSPEAQGEDHASNAPRQCGIIMPISGTETHSAEHWRWVKELVARAIRNANLVPLEVWTGSSTDRITTRIIENLFAAPIAVCVISGLNANVLLETGMRITSKKPTVVVAEADLKIPFDIGDFNVEFYPANLNYVGAEQFVSDLTQQIVTKLAAYDDNTYRPFLSGFTIDIVEPEARAVGAEDLLERRLDQLSEQVGELGAWIRQGQGQIRNHIRPTNAMPPNAHDPNVMGVLVAGRVATQLVDAINERFAVSAIDLMPMSDGRALVSVTLPDANLRRSMQQQLHATAAQLDPKAILNEPRPK
jgi:hypothetical protein